MKQLLFTVAAILAGCASSTYEQLPTDAERAAYLASLPAEDRETLELYFWALEVDPKPIEARFITCVDDRIGKFADLEPRAAAGASLDECFPIIDRLVRGLAMRVSTLATGVTHADMRSWSASQALEQRAELLVDLTQRVENERAGTGRD